MAAESKLLITIDSRKAKSDLEALNQTLSIFDQAGTKTALSADKLGMYFKNASGKIVDANGKFISAAKAADKLGVSVNDLGKYIGTYTKLQAEAAKAATGAKGGLSNAEGAVSSLTTAVTSGGGGLGTYRDKLLAVSKATGITAASITGAIGGLSAMTMAYANSAKELDNFARLADANVVEFQRLAVAGERYGLTAEQIADQMKDFNEKIGEFTLTGAGEAKDAFEFLAKNTKMTQAEVGKLAVDIQKASGPQGLQMYVNALQNAGVSQEQMSFLLENMGNDLTKLLPALMDNGKELKAMADEAERLGVILDEKAVAQALELEKQLSTLKKQIKGATNDLMQGFVPALTQTAKALNDGAGQSDLMRQAGEDMGVALKGVVSIAMGAYVVISSISRAILGVAQDAVKAKKIVDAKAEKGGILSKLPGVKLFNTAVTAGVIAGGKGSNTEDALDKNAKNAEAYAKTITELWKEAQDEINKTINQPTPKTAPKTPGLQTFYDSLKDKTQKGNKDAERLAEEIARIREQITYKYANREKQIEIDLQNELADIRKAGMGKYYEDRAINRATTEKELYKAQMEFEINEYSMTEEKKLAAKLKIDQLAATLDEQLTAKQLTEKVQALQKQHDEEVRLIKLAREERALQVSEQFLTETQIMERRYDLEMKRIQEIKDANERAFNEQMLQLQRSEQTRKQLIDAQKTWEESYAGMGGLGGMNQAQTNMLSRTDASQGLFNSQMAAVDLAAQDPAADMQEIASMREQIWFEHNQRLKMIDDQFRAESIAGNLDYASQIAGGLMGMVDQSSVAYKALYGLQKGFNLASAIMNGYTAISAAWASAPFPYNLPAVATTTAKTGVLQAAIEAVTPKGFKTGGYTGNMGVNDVAGVVHGKEYVLNAQATKRIGVDTLNAVNNGASLSSMQNAAPAAPPTVNVRNVNVLDPSVVGDYLGTDDGERLIMNVVQRNQRSLGR